MIIAINYTHQKQKMGMSAALRKCFHIFSMIAGKEHISLLKIASEWYNISQCHIHPCINCHMRSTVQLFHLRWIFNHSISGWWFGTFFIFPY